MRSTCWIVSRDGIRVALHVVLEITLKVPNLINELGTAEERRLNQFGSAG